MLPCQRTVIRRQRRVWDSSYRASSSLPSTELQASLVVRMPYSREDCQAMQTAWCPQWGGREGLLHRVNASGCWTPRRGLFDTTHAVYLTGDYLADGEACQESAKMAVPD